MINQGVSIFSRRPLLLVRAADLNLRHGNPEDARKIIEYGLRVVPNSPARLALVSLQDELPPAPPPPPDSSLLKPEVPAKKAPAKK